MELFRNTDGLDMDKLTLSYVQIEVAGEKLAVRTYTYNDDKSKKTLLMTHGIGLSSAFYARLWPKLSKKYRIVMFDHLGHGPNTRTQNVGDALDSVEKSE